ncbi:hypothetical protein [Candidatus Phytoplasma prunorum]|uniref:hypothetical protein n=1 Tax=Candidatus Phytoplasma prunorum TaxID=47565 RepID=UPI002FF055B1
MIKRSKPIIKIKIPHEKLPKPRRLLPQSGFSFNSKNKYSRGEHKKATRKIYQAFEKLKF